MIYGESIGSVQSDDSAKAAQQQANDDVAADGSNGGGGVSVAMFALMALAIVAMIVLIAGVSMVVDYVRRNKNGQRVADISSQELSYTNPTFNHNLTA